MPVDIDKAGEQVEKASSFFDKINSFIKKHPIWFALIIISGIIYWASTIELEEDKSRHHKEVIEEKSEDGYKIVKKEYLIDKTDYRYGDTIYIDYYSDGYVDKYYTDGETYEEDK